MSCAVDAVVSSLRVLAFAALAPWASAQCANLWLPAAVPGTDGEVFASVAWDPDGAGPARAVIVLGGSFGTAGGGVPKNIVTYEPVTSVWSTLGSGLTQPVRTLAVLPNGALVAGGDGILPGYPLATWTGTSWVPFAPGLVAFVPQPPTVGSFNVQSLAVLPNGDLAAGGEFAVSGAPSINAIATWNGTAWTSLGTGSSSAVTALAVMPNGDVVANGTFNSGATLGLARWNGISWSGLGTGTTGAVLALLPMPSGDLIAAGAFTSIGGVAASRIARWNGATWSALGAGIDDTVLSLGLLSNGDVVAGGTFATAGATNARKVARWTGTSWSPLGTGIDTSFDSRVDVLRELPNGHLLAAGEFTSLGSASASRVGIWDGSSWRPPVRGFDLRAGSCVKAVARAPNGDIVVGGNFTIAGIPGANSVARWNGTSWSSFGNGFPYDEVNPPIYAVAALPNGDVVVGGAVPGSPKRWNGASWLSFGTGANSSVNAVLTMPNGDLVIGGDFTAVNGVPAYGCARWNGATWSPLVPGSLLNSVSALRLLPNGDVLVAGNFTQIGGAPAGGFARTNGTTWTAFGGPVNGLVSCVAMLPNGDVVIGGSFSSAGGTLLGNIARWNGTSWQQLGSISSSVAGLEVLPDGDLVAVGNFNTAGGNIARWNGSAWISLGGLQLPADCVRMLDEGQLLVGGHFQSAGGIMTPCLARLDTTCPAQSATSGLGCPGSGGGNTLTANTLPWVDATFRATGTGLPTNALVLTLTSVTPIPQGIVPLAALFAEGMPGCDILVAPDILAAVVTSTGTATSAFLLPSSPPIVGVTFFHQMIPFELGGSGTIAITATNALQLTAGAF